MKTLRKALRKLLTASLAAVLALGLAPAPASAQAGEPQAQQLVAADPALTAQEDAYRLAVCTLEDGFTLYGRTLSFQVLVQKNGWYVSSDVKLYRKAVDPLVGSDSLAAKQPTIDWSGGNSGGDHWKLEMDNNPAGKYYLRVMIGGGYRDFAFTYAKAPDDAAIGTATLSIEAFTIGLGWIERPVRVPIRNGDTAASLLARFLDERGYTYQSTGAVNDGFYLGRIDGLSQSMADARVNRTVQNAIEHAGEHLFEASNYLADNGLGEFDFSDGSGWMYSVDGLFPNVSMSDSALRDGDVLRLHFTLALGSDIGAAGSTGGDHPDYYPVADLTEPTEYLGRIYGALNAQAILDDTGAARRVAALEAAMEDLGSSQGDVDDAYDELVRYLGSKGGYPPIGLAQGDLAMRKGQTERLDVQVGEGEGLLPQVVEWSTSDYAVAGVGPDGTVTAYGGGDAVVTARLGTSVARCAVTVSDKQLTGFRMRPNTYMWDDYVRNPDTIGSLQEDGSYLIKKQQSIWLQAVPEPADATEWEAPAVAVGDPSVASASCIGDWTAPDSDHLVQVRGLSKGSTTVNVRIGELSQDVRVQVADDGVEGIRLVEDASVLQQGGEVVDKTGVVIYAGDSSAAWHDWVDVLVAPDVEVVARDTQGTSVDVGDPSIVDATLVQAKNASGYGRNWYRLHLTSKADPSATGATDVRVRLGTHTAVVHVEVRASHERWKTPVANVYYLSRTVPADETVYARGITFLDEVVGGQALQRGQSRLYSNEAFVDGIGVYRRPSCGDLSGSVVKTAPDGTEATEAFGFGTAQYSYLPASTAYRFGAVSGVAGTTWADFTISAGGRPVSACSAAIVVADEVVPVASLSMLDAQGAELARGAQSGAPEAGEIALGIGQEAALGYAAAGEGSAEPTGAAVWYCDDPQVARVDARTGELTGVSAGTANVYVVFAGWVARAAVTVAGPAATGLSLARERVELAAGEDACLTALLSPAGASGEVAWATSDPAVATVDAAGRVRAAGAGECTVTASAGGGLSASCTVVVADNPLRDAWFEKGPYTLVRGQEADLADGLSFRTADGQAAAPDLAGASWRTTDASVATVSDDGALVAVGAGTCDVYCAVGGAEARTTVTVTVPLEGIRLEYGDGTPVGEGGVTLPLNGRMELRAVPEPLDTTDIFTVTWMSTRPNWVGVSDSAVSGWNPATHRTEFYQKALDGLRPGASTVTVSAGAHVASVKVTVARTPEQQAVFEMQQAVSLFASDYPDLTAAGVAGAARVLCVADADAAVARWAALSDAQRAQVPGYADVFTAEALAFVEDLRAALACEELMLAAAGGGADAAAAARAAYGALSDAQRACVDAAAVRALEAAERELATDVADAEVEVAACSYTGRPLEPAVTAELGGKALRAGADFTVSYAGNRAAGTGRATITGRGSYHGTKTVAFAIAKGKNSATPAKLKLSRKLSAQKLSKKAARLALPKVKAKFGKPRWKVVKKCKGGTLALKSGGLVAKRGAKKGTYKIVLRAVVDSAPNWTSAKTAPVTVEVRIR